MKPGTELPWEIATGADGTVVSAESAPFGVLRCKKVDDAAYIVHSANAYPRLVDFLQRFVAIMTYHKGWLEVRGVLDFEDKARALLEELGE